MKINQEKYPMGSFRHQKSPGRYVDDYLISNLEPLAEKIVDDMQFMGLCCSSTFEVRTGKSTFLQQMGEAWNWLMEQKHGIKLDLNMRNIVFKTEDLIKRSFELPRYSFMILDENDEIDEHYFSKLAKELRRFFKKCGQLNLFIMLVVPNFFQLRPSYAIGRTNFLIDVKFKGKFERGFFDFYSFQKKKKLYIEGKKTQNYNCVSPDFEGRFFGGYVVDKNYYMHVKRKDLEESEEKPFDPKQQRREIFREMYENLVKTKKITMKELHNAFGIVSDTAYRWLKEEDNKEVAPVPLTIPTERNIQYTDNISEGF